MQEINGKQLELFTVRLTRISIPHSMLVGSLYCGRDGTRTNPDDYRSLETQSMRFIFAEHERSFQLRRMREGIDEFRNNGRSDPDSFLMHPVYDNILRQLADHFLGYWKNEMALVGLGGYGRKEMSPYSDIDILFLRPENAPEGIYRGIRSMLYLLWDARVELGHSVRTVAECVHEADKDLAVLTSLMDTRIIWGSKDLFRGLEIQRARMIQETSALDLYSRIESEIRKSYEKFGHTIYLLEPHLKEGPGSLRYFQLITWLARLVFGCSTLDDLAIAGLCGQKSVEEAYDARAFLEHVRTRLHFLIGRRDDRLKFDTQTVLAEQMGYEDRPERRGVESFMRDYYRHASTLDFFGRRILAKARLFLRPKIATGIKRLNLNGSFYIGAGGINRYSADESTLSPEEMLSAFKEVGRTGCALDIRLVDLILEGLRSMGDDIVNDPKANRLFLDILRNPGSVGLALTAMMKVGFLERFITEFARVRFLPQHDVYHQYTVDLHTMAVIENIDSFSRAEKDSEDTLLKTIFSRLEKPEVLYLAALFHDMAKGQGPGHEVKGAEIARPVLQRLGLSGDDIDDVCFLIRNHLAMTHLAFKKDLHDADLINRFAENVMSKRRLDLLLLLTHADLRAVGPTAYSSWRGMLLEELYYRTLDVLEGEGLEGEDLAEWVAQIKSVVRELVPPEHRGAPLEAFLGSAGSRYFLDFYPGLIVEHYLDIRRYLQSTEQVSLSDTDVISRKLDHRGRAAYSAVTLITRDRPGLFFRIAGTLSANRANILSAWSHSIGDLAIGTFHVNDIPEGPLDDPVRWEKFRSDFAGVVRGEIDVDELVAARRQMRCVFPRASTPQFPLKVVIDNMASDRATIVEVYAHDRPGLLYDITRSLSGLGLDIVLAKITTEVDQAADVFYVRDETGKRIVEFDRLEAIENGLRDHLAAMEQAHFGTVTDAAGSGATVVVF